MTSTSIVAVVPAAGIGSRMQADRPKQYLYIGNKTILEHTLTILSLHPGISRVIVALSPNDSYFETLGLRDAPWLTVVDGGETRAESVFNAINHLQYNEWALVHDAARPCLNSEDLTGLLNRVNEPTFNGAILATPVRDTMKRATISANGATTVLKTESREQLWHALTPQLFRAQDLKKALLLASEAGAEVTDEASAMEFAGHPVELIDSDPANIKITRPADLPLAQFYLHKGSTTQCE